MAQTPGASLRLRRDFRRAASRPAQEHAASAIQLGADDRAGEGAFHARVVETAGKKPGGELHGKLWIRRRAARRGAEDELSIRAQCPGKDAREGRISAIRGGGEKELSYAV